MTRVVDGHDVALFDLDGVVYLGPSPVPGAAAGIDALRRSGVRCAYVTNNAARTPAQVAAQLRSLGIECGPEDVTNSGQAAARMLAERLPAGSRVLVSGTEALKDEVRSHGLHLVPSAREEPVGVLMGYDPELRWPILNEVAHAVQAGAVWIATNTDSNRPTDRGLVPGHGTAVAAVRAAVTTDPVVAGKPETPLMAEAVRRCGATSAIFVGDRLDTDVAGGVAAGLATMLVFSGSHGKSQLLTATAAERPDHLGLDLRALLDPPLEVHGDDSIASCEDARVGVDGGQLQVLAVTPEPRSQLALLRAAAELAWARPGLDPAQVWQATPDVPLG